MLKPLNFLTNFWNVLHGSEVLRLWYDPIKNIKTYRIVEIGF